MLAAKFGAPKGERRPPQTQFFIFSNFSSFTTHTHTHTHTLRSAAVVSTPFASSKAMEEAPDFFTTHPEMEKFRKMAKMGIPLPSVEHKMTTENVSDALKKEFGAIMGGGGGGGPAKAEAKDDGEDDKPKYGTENENDNGNEKLSKEELTAKYPDLAKYVKMTKIGVPPPSAAQKLLKDGIGAAAVLEFKRTFDLLTKEEEEEASMLNSGSSAPAPSVKLSKDELTAKYPDLAKYVKMTKIGVPPPSAAQKLAKDEIPAEQILHFKRTFDLLTKEEEASILSGGASRNASEPVNRRTSVKMKQIHFKAVSEEKLGGERAIHKKRASED